MDSVLSDAIAASDHIWLETTGGIKFLATSHDSCVFLLPAPEGGYYLGALEGFTQNGKVTRLDFGAVPARVAVAVLEECSRKSGRTFRSKNDRKRLKAPAYRSQLETLKKMKVRYSIGIRRGGAADLILISGVSWSLDHRFAAKYVHARG